MTKANNQPFLITNLNLKIVGIGIYLLITSSIRGQNISEPPSDVRSVFASSTSYQNVSIGLNAGISNGIGLDLAYRFSEHWAVKVGYNYADYTKNNYTYDIISRDSTGIKDIKTLSFDVYIKLSNMALNVEYYPKANGRLKFIGGLSYFFNNTITVGAQAISIIKVNDVLLNSDDIGSGTVQVGFNSKVSPFLGLGFGRTFPRKRIGVNFDVGTYYKTNYKVVIHVKPGIILDRNEENEAVLTRNFNEKWYGKFWPIINLRLTYGLKLN